MQVFLQVIKPDCMKILTSISSTRDYIKSLIVENKQIGFVPTMGALHEGHLSLIEASNRENDITAVSIFVNPAQFNDEEDLQKYPRPIEKDIEILEKANCNFLFNPSPKEMYPFTQNISFDFGYLDKIMEGKHRPGHFSGVALIVSKLFNIIQPQRAYFGKKDFQQLAIIKQMVKILNFPVSIKSCPIIREKSGLAMSSRNNRLNDKERNEAALIYKTLNDAVSFSENHTVNETKAMVMKVFEKHPFFEPEYFEIVEADTLKAIDNWDTEKDIIGCTAVNVGKVRLIDNVKFN